MIYISGFLLLELSSVLISRAFFERLPMSSVLNVAKKGYRIKPYREEDFSFLLNEYEEQLIKTKQEVKLVPTLKFLMQMVGSKVFKTIFEMFTLQYVSDSKAENPNFVNELK